jgi:hypothetical protein
VLSCCDIGHQCCLCAVMVGVHAGDASSLGAFEQAFQQPQELVEQEVRRGLMKLLPFQTRYSLCPACVCLHSATLKRFIQVRNP